MFIEWEFLDSFPAPEERNIPGYWKHIALLWSSFFDETGYKHLAALRPGDFVQGLEPGSCQLISKKGDHDH